MSSSPRGFIPTVVGLVFIWWLSTDYHPITRRVILEETRRVTTQVWRGGGGVEKRGFVLAEHRFSAQTELTFRSESRTHSVRADYHLTAATFERVQTHWLDGSRAIYIRGQNRFQGGSYDMLTGPFEIVYDYDRNHLWTTLTDIDGYVTKQEFDDALHRLEQPKANPQSRAQAQRFSSPQGPPP